MRSSVRGLAVALLSVAALFYGANPALAAPPANDNFAGAITFSSIPFSPTVSNVEATTEVGEPQGNCAKVGASVWWRYAPTSNVTLDVSLAASNFDTVLNIWHGSSIASLTGVTCNDDISPSGTIIRQSRIDFTAQAGEVYYIQAGGWQDPGILGEIDGPAVGTIAMTVSRATNNLFSTFTEIGSLPFNHTQSTAGATKEGGEPSPSCQPSTGATVWFRYRSTLPTQTLLASTVGSSFDSVVAVYSLVRGTNGTSFTHLSPVACSDNASGTAGRAFFSALKDNTYFVQVGGAGGATGSLSFSLTAPAPDHDAFASALSATAPYADSLRGTSNASREQFEPRPSCQPHGGASVWYRYVASQSGPVFVTTAGSKTIPTETGINFPLDTVLAVYTGGSLGSLSQVACNDTGAESQVQAALSFTATIGVTYRIQVSGVNNATGLLEFVLNQGPVNDSFSATRGLTLGATDRISTLGATSQTGEPSTSCQPRSGASVWYRYSSGFSPSRVAVDTSSSNFDTILGVYTGPSVSALTQVACNDDISGETNRASRVVFNPAPSTTYYIQASGIAAQTGILNIGLSSVSSAVPANDAFANATIISAVSTSTSQSTIGAVLDGTEGAPACDSGSGASVWFKFTSSSARALVATTQGSDFDTTLSVMSGSSPTGSVGCSTSGANEADPAARLAFTTASTTTTYWFQVSGAGAATGNLSFGLIAAPSNNNATGVITIPASPYIERPYSARQYTYNATLETPSVSRTEDTPTCERQIGASVWYRYIPPSGGTFTVSTTGSDFDTVAAVYTGSAPSEGVLRACSDDASPTSSFKFVATPNTIYLFQFGGFRGDSGDLAFSISQEHNTTAPVNDAFASPAAASGSGFRGVQTTVGATREASEPFPSCETESGQTVWYSYTPATDQQVTATTAASDIDTVVAAYTGSTLAALTEVACNDNRASGDLSSQVSFPASAGTTYLFQVSGDGNEIGNTVFRLVPGPNNSFSSAQPIALGSTTRALVVGATDESGEPDAACQPLGEGSSWYRLALSTDRFVTLTTAGSDFDSILGVYTGSSLGSLTQIACNDDIAGAGNPASSVSFAAASGTEYLVQVSGYRGAGGNLALAASSVPIAPSPSNDAFASAATTSGSSAFDTVQSTVGSSTQAGEPAPSCGAGAGKSVWYKFGGAGTPAGTLTVNTAGSDFDTVLAAYTGSFPALVEVGCDDNLGSSLQSQLVLSTLANTTYYLQASGAGGAAGNLAFHLSSPQNNNFASASPLGSGATGSTAGANREKGEPVNACQPDSGATAWYTVTPAATGFVTIDASASGIDSALAVYSGSTLSGLTSVACGDDNGLSSSGRLTFPGTAGSTYYVQVGGFGAVTGPISLVKSEAATAPVATNDSFASAATVAPSALVGYTGGATREAGEPEPTCETPTGASVWYRWRPEAVVSLTANTLGSDYDTVLAVYTGTTLAGLSEVACNDDLATGTPQSQITLTTTATDTYYFQASGAGTSTGNLVFGVSTPANNNLTSAVAATSSFTNTASSVGATREKAEPDPLCQNQSGATLWYTYTPTQIASVTASTTGSSFNTVLAAYSGGSLGTLTNVACNDNDGANQTSKITFTAVPGTTYLFQLGGYLSQTGTAVFNLTSTVTAAPANNAFASPKVVPGTGYSNAQATALATRESGEPTPSCEPASGQSVWYRYVPGEVKTIAVNTAGSDFDTVLAVYRGTTLASLASMGCSDDLSGSDSTSALSFSSTASDTYFIQVSGAGTSVGGLVLNLSSSGLSTGLTPGNNNFASATTITTHEFRTDQATNGATTESGEPTPSCVSSAGASVWFKYTAAASASVSIDTYPSNYNQVLAVWRGSALSSLTQVACDNSGISEYLEFDATSGTTYFIQVAGVGGAAGDLWLSLKSPVHDHRADARFTFAGYSDTDNTTTATRETGEPVPSCQTAFGRSVWYSVVAPADGTITIDTVGSAFDSVLGAYESPSLDEVGCNDDIAAGNTASRLRFPVEAGGSYRMQVSGFSNLAGALAFHVPAVAVPASFAAAPGPAAGEITLSWAVGNDTGVDAYDLYRTVGTDPEALLATLPGTQLAYTDTGFANGAGAAYRLVARNAISSASTGSVSGIAFDTPSAPQSLAAQAGPAAGQIRLTWGAPASGGAAQYKVFRGTASGSLTLLSTLGNVLTYTDSGLGNGETRFYAVRAVNPVGESLDSAEVSATTFAAPSAPTNVATSAGPLLDQINVSWDAPASNGGGPSPTIASFLVCRGPSTTTMTECTTVPGTQTSFEDTGRGSGTYQYSIAAVNSLGAQGAGSAPVCAKILPWHPLLGC